MAGAGSLQFDWDSAYYILIVTGMLAAPSLLVLPWIWLTKNARIRTLLMRAMLAAFSAPFIGAGTFAIFSGFCERGHIDQPLGECRYIPDTVAVLIPMGLVYLAFGLAAITTVYCVVLEIRGHNSR